MKNVWTVVCKNSITDSDTNSLSLLETLDEIHITYREKIETNKEKILPISFHVVSLWFDEDSKTDRKFDLAVEITDPSGKLLKDFKQECIIPIGKRRLRATTKIQGFGFTDQGKYLVTIKYREDEKTYKKVTETPIDVNLIKSINPEETRN